MTQNKRDLGLPPDQGKHNWIRDRSTDVSLVRSRTFEITQRPSKCPSSSRFSSPNETHREAKKQPFRYSQALDPDISVGSSRPRPSSSRTDAPPCIGTSSSPFTRGDRDTTMLTRPRSCCSHALFPLFPTIALTRRKRRRRRSRVSRGTQIPQHTSVTTTTVWRRDCAT